MFQVLSPLETAALKVRLAAHVTRLALEVWPSASEVRRAVDALLGRGDDWARRRGATKIVRVDGRYRLAPPIPAWPSPAFDTWARRALRHGAAPSLSTAMVAVTTRCPLACVHCSAADELGPHEALALDELRRVVGQLQSEQVSMFDWTGGEPLSRLDDLTALVAQVAPAAASWVNTSGWGLDAEVAARLAAAGLDGVWLSIDGEDGPRHDAVRGRPGAFDRARRAAAAARGAGLSVGLSVVATRALVERGGLPAVADLATAWGGWALRIVEAKAVGRWAGQADVTLSPAHEEAVAAFADDANGGPRRAALPVVLAVDVLHRRLGCRAAGYRTIYVDTRGRVHGCPFCAHGAGDLVTGTLADALRTLRARGCTRFAAPPEVS